MSETKPKKKKLKCISSKLPMEQKSVVITGIIKKGILFDTTNMGVFSYRYLNLAGDWAAGRKAGNYRVRVAAKH